MATKVEPEEKPPEKQPKGTAEDILAAIANLHPQTRARLVRELAPAKKEEPAGTAASLLNQADQLPAEEREKLLSLGCIVPQGANAAESADGKFTKGYRCPQCNGLALFFSGTKWGPNGEFTEPQQGMRLDQLGWTQTKAPERINRRNPLCQSCGASVVLDDGAFIIGSQINGEQIDSRRGLVVDVENYQAAIDKHYNYRRKLQLRRQVASGKVVRHNPDGSTWEGSPDMKGAPNTYDASLRAQDFLRPPGITQEMWDAGNEQQRAQWNTQAKADLEYANAQLDFGKAFEGGRR